MPRWVAIALGCVTALVAAVCATASAAQRPATDCRVGPGTQLILSRSYRFVLRLGPVENMWMPYQVRASHPKHGEVMLRGRMIVPTHGPLHHLEVHICMRPTRAVVTKADPTIVLVDNTSRRKPYKLPVAVMEGIGEGRADLHYGNNVAMPHHHRFTIAVTYKAQRAAFHIAAP